MRVVVLGASFGFCLLSGPSLDWSALRAQSEFDKQEDAAAEFRDQGRPEWWANERVLKRSLQGEKIGEALELLGSSEARRARQALSQENLKGLKLYVHQDRVKRRMGSENSPEDPHITGMKSVNGILSFETEAKDLFDMVERASSSELIPKTGKAQVGAETQRANSNNSSKKSKQTNIDLIGTSER